MLAQSFVVFTTLSLVIARPLAHYKRALDLGSCQDATIKFANGLDGRTEPAFAPNDPGSFDHGSALNIGVISGFICQQLNDKCKAGQDALAACAAGQAASAGKTGQAAADAFNAALGGAAGASSSAASAAAAPPPPAATDAAASDCVQSTVTVTAAAAANTDASAANSTPPAAASAAAAPAAGAGGNFQKFTGSLGGLPPPVETGGKGFVVTGSDDFINLGAAVQRSCDIQHNACADQANSGGGFSVSQCDAQDTACVAANK